MKPLECNLHFLMHVNYLFLAYWMSCLFRRRKIVSCNCSGKLVFVSYCNLQLGDAPLGNQ